MVMQKRFPNLTNFINVYVKREAEMLEEEHLKRKSARIAAHEAAKRIKKEATLVFDPEEEEHSSSSDEAHATQDTIQTVPNATSSSSRRGCKRKRLLDEVFDPTLSPSEAQAISDLSKKVDKILKAMPPNCDDGQKRRRGRPRKCEAADTVGPCSPASARCKRSMTYKNSPVKQGKGVCCDIDRRRETHNTSPVKDELIIPTFFSSPKELVPGSRDISYKESLMKFSKDLGPIAQRVANHMLLNRVQDLQQQPQSKTQPMLPPEPESWHAMLLRRQQPPLHQPVLKPQPQPQSFSCNLRPSLNKNQVDRRLLPIGGSSKGSVDVTADYKGKKLMAEDDKQKGKGLDLHNNLGFLLANPKGGIKISEEYQDTRVEVQSRDWDFLRLFTNKVSEVKNNPDMPIEACLDRPKARVADVNRENNLADHQSGNQKTINQINYFLSDNRRILNENSPKSFRNNDAAMGTVNCLNAFQATPGDNLVHGSSVLPSTYIQPSRKNSNLLLSLGGTTSAQSDPPPSMLGMPRATVHDPPEFRIEEPATPQPNWLPSITTSSDPFMFQIPQFCPSPSMSDPPSLAVSDTMRFHVQELAPVPPKCNPPPPLAICDPPQFQIQDAFSQEEPMVVSPLTQLVTYGLNPRSNEAQGAISGTSRPLTSAILHKQLHQPPALALTPSSQDATGEEELRLAIASYLQIPESEPNLLLHNAWSLNKPSMFDNDAFWPQDRMLMPTPPPPSMPQLPPQIPMFGVPNFHCKNLRGIHRHEQGSLQLDKSPDLGLQLGNTWPQPPAGS